jgi:steroid delta-isomerase-like uncharacterized protein
LPKTGVGRVAGVGVGDLVRGYVAALNAGDVEGVLEHVAADFVSEHTSALGESFTGRDEYRARLPAFFALLPERRYEIEDVLVDGERAAVPYTLRAAGAVIRGVFLFACRDGLIARRVDYWDSAEFLRQRDAT